MSDWVVEELDGEASTTMVALDGTTLRVGTPEGWTVRELTPW